MFSEPEMYKHLLEPEYNPKVIFQPVMCQHCNNAPCETVCPGAATSHGRQGQNMMARVIALTIVLTKFGGSTMLKMINFISI